MNAETSKAFSQLIGKLLAIFFPGGGEADGGDHLLRKLAHFTEFTCLGILLSWLIRMLRQNKWQWFALPLCFGALAACVDETIQIFVPGRGPGILDVGIDTLGVTLGIVLIYLYECIKSKFWRKL